MAIVGYELFFHAVQHATAAAYHSFVELDAFSEQVAGKTLFIALSPSLINHELILSMTAPNLLLELYDILVDDDLVRRVEQLYLEGLRFSFLLQSPEQVKQLAALHPFLSAVRLDMRTLGIDDVTASLLQLGLFNVELVAKNVDTRARFAPLKAMGITRFQGEFIAQAEIVDTTTLSVDVQKIIEISNMLAQGETTSAIALQLQEVPSVVVSLFKHLNASSYALKSPVDSVERVIVLLGREKLKQWLFLMLYALHGDTDTRNDALFEQVVFRVNVLSELCRPVLKAHNAVVLAKVRFMGIISLLDVLTHISKTDFYTALHVDAMIIDAIETQTGDFGAIYDVMLSIEQYDLEKIERYMHQYGFDAAMLQGYLARSWSQFLSHH